MKILALEKDIGGNITGNYQELLRDEAKMVWDLYQQELIREIYFRTDQKTAVILLECADPGEAKSILSKLPLVKANLIQFDLIPLSSYSGFERLFGNDQVQKIEMETP